MKGGVAMETSVETLGVDWRTKEKARRKHDVRFSLIRKKSDLSENYMRSGVRKLLRRGLVPARAWRGQPVGIAPTERVKLRRQMAAAAAGRRDRCRSHLSWK